MLFHCKQTCEFYKKSKRQGDIKSVYVRVQGNKFQLQCKKSITEKVNSKQQRHKGQQQQQKSSKVN